MPYNLIVSSSKEGKTEISSIQAIIAEYPRQTDLPFGSFEKNVYSMKKMGRGGIRAGAGRPPGPLDKKYVRGMSFKVPPDFQKLIDAVANRLGISRSEVLRRGVMMLAESLDREQV